MKTIICNDFSKYHRVCLFACLLLIIAACSREQSRLLNVDFSYTAVNNNYTVPATIHMQNDCSGADYFLWTFEGGSPATSSSKLPGAIYYDVPGSYTITLAAWNAEGRKEITRIIQIDSIMLLDFDVVFMDNDTLPAIVKCINKSHGALSYTWSFEGALPEEQQLVCPEQVLYSSGERHEIILSAFNGRITRSFSKIINFSPALSPIFEIIPNESCEDYQVPFIAKMNNQSISANTFLWHCSGGSFSPNDTKEPQLYINTPGSYTVQLQVRNKKETKIATRALVVLGNTNLQYFKNLKFGIVRAGSNIGYAFSAQLRRVLTEHELLLEDGRKIDLVFLGLNADFEMCRFLSPDSSAHYALSPISNATKTNVINKFTAGTPELSVAVFDEMKNDAALRLLNISAHDSGRAFFNKTEHPQIILFETINGRKGAVKIIDFVNAGDNSYLLCDIKIQKQPL